MGDSGAEHPICGRGFMLEPADESRHFVRNAFGWYRLEVDGLASEHARHDLHRFRPLSPICNGDASQS